MPSSWSQRDDTVVCMPRPLLHGADLVGPQSQLPKTLVERCSTGLVRAPTIPCWLILYASLRQRAGRRRLRALLLCSHYSRKGRRGRSARSAEPTMSHRLPSPFRGRWPFFGAVAHSQRKHIVGTVMCGQSRMSTGHDAESTSCRCAPTKFRWVCRSRDTWPTDFDIPWSAARGRLSSRSSVVLACNRSVPSRFTKLALGMSRSMPSTALAVT